MYTFPDDTRSAAYTQQQNKQIYLIVCYSRGVRQQAIHLGLFGYYACTLRVHYNNAVQDGNHLWCIFLKTDTNKKKNTVGFSAAVYITSFLVN